MISLPIIGTVQQQFPYFSSSFYVYSNFQLISHILLFFLVKNHNTAHLFNMSSSVCCIWFIKPVPGEILNYLFTIFWLNNCASHKIFSSDRILSSAVITFYTLLPDNKRFTTKLLSVTYDKHIINFRAEFVSIAALRMT